ncbi:hypothetical protein JAAARDRAFT_39528 [Jaapia argillacea MUCL 33604]|uniref:DUF6593 domain-containing protein n=1 Tax=Jaapia argillacea MUCL 33604 TaxID=933084 RepID=A0A067PH47_9AGAM|nr:hypothetical protein JAAARDRAFT_39528 [Jaapia argillacea MUCL 33604]
MKFTLTKDDPKRTTLVDEEGREVYKIATPRKFVRETTTISHRSAGHPLSATTTSEPLQGDADSEEHVEGFTEFARIYWHTINPTELMFNGQKTALKEAMVAKGFLYRDRQFQGPNGISYRWKMPSTGHLELYVDDESKTQVATLHGASMGILNKKHPAILEIHPVGEHMVDLIVATFVYVEHIRIERERANMYNPVAYGLYKSLLS